MRIISKFKDYYDAVWYNTGQGDIFVREKKSIDYKPDEGLSDFLRQLSWHYDDHKDKSFSVVFFCEEVFVLEYDCEFVNGSYHRHVMGKCIDKARTRYITTDKLPIRKSFLGNYDFKLSENTIEKLHTDLQSPIIIWDRYDRDFKINQNLSHIHFGMVYGPNEAFQRIEMFNSNFLFRKDDAIVPVGDDKTRIVAAGFDLKTSFRKSK